MEQVVWGAVFLAIMAIVVAAILVSAAVERWKHRRRKGR